MYTHVQGPNCFYAQLGYATERLSKIEESMGVCVCVWGEMHPLMGTLKAGMFVCARHAGRLYKSTIVEVFLLTSILDSGQTTQ